MAGKVGKFIIGAALIGAGLLTGNLAIAGIGLKSLFVSAGVSMALNAVLSVSQRQQAIEVNEAHTQSPLPVVYGRARLGLRLVDIRVDPNSDDNKDMYLVGALCHGSADGQGVAAIEEIYLDDKLAVDASGTVQEPFTGLLTVTKKTGVSSPTVDSTLNAKFPTAWPSTSKGAGVAYIVLKLVYDKEVFAHGIPNVTAVVKGNVLYDPRTGTTAWSTNPALAIRDYLTAPVYGLGATSDEINDAAFISMANYYDEDVTTTGGGTKDRFSTNGWVDTGEALGNNLHALLTSCRGNLVYEGGEFRLFTKRVVTPTTFALTEHNIVGDWDFHLPGVGEVPNRVEIVYIDPEQEYTPVTMMWPRPGASNSYLTADNNFLVQRRIELPYTNDRYQAEQIGMTLLKEAREGISVELTAKEEALQLQVGDVVPVTHSTPGWTAKNFWVMGVVLLPNGLVRLALSEYEAAVYSLDAQSTTGTSPDTNLPDPFEVAPPTNLQLYSDTTTAIRMPDGSLQARIKATWTRPSGTPFLSHYEVLASKDGLPGSYVGTPDDIDTEFTFGPVATDSVWRVYIRAVNTLGRKSDWVQGTIRSSATNFPRRPGNMLLNGDGQEGAADGTQAPQWTKNAGSNLQVTDSDYYSGDRALTLVHGASTDSSHYQAVGLLADRTYRLSGRIKATGALTGTGAGACLQLTKSDGSTPSSDELVTLERVGSNVTGVNTAPEVGLTKASITTSWQEVSLIVRAETDLNLYAWVKAGVGGGVAGTVRFDDIRLEEISPKMTGLLDLDTGRGYLPPSTQQWDDVAPRGLVKGKQFGICQDGDTVVFEVPFQDPPRVVLAGGVLYQPDSTQWSPGYSATKPQIEDLIAYEVTASQFKVRAKLYQPGATTTTYTHSLPSTELDLPGETAENTLVPGGAQANQYTVRLEMYAAGQAKSTFGAARTECAVDYSPDGGGTWYESAVLTHSWPIEPGVFDGGSSFYSHVVNAVLDSGDKIRLRFVDAYTTVPATTSDGWAKGRNNTTPGTAGIQYVVASDNITTKTPTADDYIKWEAEGYT